MPTNTLGLFALFLTEPDLSERIPHQCRGQIVFEDPALAEPVGVALEYWSMWGLYPNLGDGVINVRVDPSQLRDGEGGVTLFSGDGTCEIVLRRADMWYTMIHEFGHALGFGHHETGIMRG